MAATIYANGGGDGRVGALVTYTRRAGQSREERGDILDARANHARRGGIYSARGPITCPGGGGGPPPRARAGAPAPRRAPRGCPLRRTDPPRWTAPAPTRAAPRRANPTRGCRRRRWGSPTCTVAASQSHAQEGGPAPGASSVACQHTT
eukprot:1185754-Prorocentrum_minimum.AAC.1